MQVYIPTKDYNDVLDIQTDIRKETGSLVNRADIVVDLLAEALKQRKLNGQSGNHTKNEVATFNAWETLDKSSLKHIRENIVEKVQNGEVSALKVLQAIVSFQKVFSPGGNEKGVKDLIMEAALEEWQKEGVGTAIWKGNFYIESCETGVSYDFGDDPVLAELEAKKKEAEKAVKQRQEFLKNVRQPDSIKGIEPQTELHGDELIELRPPVKKSKTSLKFTLKK